MSSGGVEGVLGPLDVSALGRTLIHEHLFISTLCYWSPEDDPSIAYEPVSLERLTDIRANAFACRDNLTLDDGQVALSEVERYRAAGGATLVEVTPAGMGRDPRALAWIAESSGVNIVAGCGYYISASHPAGFESRSVESIAEEMIADLTVGIDSTSIKAGVIGEIGMATSPMDPTEERVLQAAAAAQQASGAAIITHCAPGEESAFEIASILEKAGADLERVVISHLDERFRANIGLFRDLAGTGVRFGFDTFGRDIYYGARRRQHPSDAIRIEAICELLAAGLGDHILVAQDVCMRHELAHFGGQGYAHVLTQIVPRLRDRGVSENEIDVMLVENPRTVLAGA